MKILFNPAIALMNRLRYSQKMFLVAVIFLLPLVVTMYMVLSELNKKTDFSQKERFGIEYISVLRTLLENVPQHRGMNNAFLRGDPTFKEKLTAKQARIEKDIKAIDAIDKEFGRTLETTEKWNALKEKWHNLQSQLSGLQAKEGWDAHTELIADIISLMQYVGKVSNLHCDPDISVHSLVEGIAQELPPLIEYLGQVRGLGTGILASKTLTIEEKYHLVDYPGRIKLILDSMNINMQAAFRNDPNLRLRLETHLEESIIATNTFLDFFKNKIIAVEDFELQPIEYFAAGTQAIDVCSEFYDAGFTTIDSLLQVYQDKLAKKKYFVGSVALVALVIVIYLFVGFYLSVRNAISNLEKATSSVASGDLSGRVNLETRDELALLAKSFNKMTQDIKSSRDALLASKVFMDNIFRSMLNTLIVVNPDAKFKWSIKLP